ncbi:MAG: hypothetical protein D6722_23560 [Bacteroidetes bacterium]|nr:MAG: hypothetical protein D6722_23560 [Bacteroidota bacterium]
MPDLSYAWDRYREGKAAREAGDVPALHEALDALVHLPEAIRHDTRLGNACGWLLYYQAKACLQATPPDTAGVRELLLKARAFAYDRSQTPNPCSLLLRQAIKIRPQFPEFLAWVRWWNLDRLQPEDYVPYTPPGGQPLMTLAEQAWLALGKALVAGGESGARPDPAELETYVVQVGWVLDAHPDFEFLPYMRAQVYMALDQPEHALENLRPFVRAHSHQFWAWDWLGRAYYRLGETEAARACLARALSERTPAAMLVTTRERYARLAREMGHETEAKACLQQVIRTRMETWGRLPKRLEREQASDWYQATEAAASRDLQIGDWARQATTYLYDDLPEELAVVTAVSRAKGMAWYRLDRERSGNLRLHELDVPAEVYPGDALRLRVQAQAGKEEVWYRALTARPTDEPLPPDLARSFQGTLVRPEGKPYGFVDHKYFVPPALLQESDLPDGTSVQGGLIMDYDRKRKKWGWMVVRLEEA